MYCRVIACDFDGTGATNGHPAPELYAALGAARTRGIVSLLVTGRVLEEVQRACEDLSPFDAVIAENGAVVHLCDLGRTIQIGRPPSEHFLGGLRAEGGAVSYRCCCCRHMGTACQQASRADSSVWG